ncbi:MAG: Ldh family oxidoreductase [Gemmataceae bacterium]
MPTLAAADLSVFAQSLFTAAGVPVEEAAILAASLVDSQLAGHDSHGVIRVVQYIQALESGILQPGVTLRIEHETPAVIVADGQWGFGQVQAHRLLDMLIPRARGLGIAAGTLYQCGHIGRLGEYGERAAREGVVLIGTVNSHGFGIRVAPPGGKAGRIGTNPLLMAVPTSGEPVVLDISPSVCAEGKVRVALNKGQPLPPGWLLDAEGRPTTDPAALYTDPPGTILPLGGEQSYKGFGLGLLLDMLAGGLSGAPCSTPGLKSRSANAVVFIVLDPERFAGIAHFRTETGNLAANVRSCPTIAPEASITLPGDPERRCREQRQRDGIALDEGTWNQLTALARRLQVGVPT